MDATLPKDVKHGSWRDFVQTRPIEAAAFMIIIGGAATILGAWFFQFGLGIKPCPLCLEQRYPYYFSIPLAVLLYIGSSAGSQRKVLIAGLGAIAAGMLWNAGLATYHAGVEWKFWPGPQECSGPLDSLGGSLMDQLKSISVVRCDQAAWRFLGISLAGYNVLISLALAAVAAWGALAGRRQPLPQH